MMIDEDHDYNDDADDDGNNDQQQQQIITIILTLVIISPGITGKVDYWLIFSKGQSFRC